MALRLSQKGWSGSSRTRSAGRSWSFILRILRKTRLITHSVLLSTIRSNIPRLQLAFWAGAWSYDHGRLLGFVRAGYECGPVDEPEHQLECHVSSQFWTSASTHS